MTTEFTDPEEEAVMHYCYTFAPVEQSPQREALQRCVVEGVRRSLLEEIWRSDDLGTMRAAFQRLPNVPGHNGVRFSNALKQMSG